MLFRVESIVNLDREQVNRLSQHIDDVNRGLFFMISGISLSLRNEIKPTSFSLIYALDPDNYDGEPMNCFRKAFDIFEINQDDIFILLTARLIINWLEENGTKNDEQELQQFRKIFDLLLNSEELEELNFDGLFENFDHRLNLARHLAKTLKNVEIGVL